MRVVSWNCCDSFNRKFGHLERLGPDLAFLQEVRPECLKFAGLKERSAWTGDPGQKGLAVVAYNGRTLSPAPVVVSERWFLPLVARKGDETFHLVAVWVDSARDCGPPTVRALDQLADFIRAAPSIIAGDFNQTVSLDKGKPERSRFATVLKKLDSMGLVSAWHGHREEAHGAETSASLFWRWNAEAKYHIDFIFASAALKVEGVTLGSFDQYVAGEISDHVPLSVNFA